MKYIKHFSNLSGQTAYLAEADIDTYLGYVDENDTVYYDDVIPVSYKKQYFTIESLGDGNTIYLKASSSTVAKTISASTDNGETWVEYTSSVDDNGTALATLNTGDKLLIKGENPYYTTTTSNYNHFTSTGQFNVYGNIMSLISGDSFVNADTLTDTYTFGALFSGATGLTSAENLILPATTLTRNCYANMFYNCTSLITAPQLSATTLANNCYLNMFQGCTNLTTAPSLPATTLARSCYEGMFQTCMSLTKAPELPATTLAESCYMSMFSDCTNLTTAPVLPADTLASQCYGGMFFGCTSLNYIKAMFTTTPSNLYTFNWVKGVASSGTFVKNAAATWNVTSTYGIPYGWTVVDA